MCERVFELADKILSARMSATNQLTRSRHSVSALPAHLVFVSKYRRPVLSALMLDEMEDLFRSVLGPMDAGLVEFNGEADHVHLVVRYPPSVSISEIVGRLKGCSSRRLRLRYRGLVGKTIWSPSSFASSSGSAPLDVLKRYIENQRRPE